MSNYGDRTDIRQHSDNELSLIVMNDEMLYNSRNRRGFVDLLNDIFLYTDEQLDVLKRDLEDEEKENAS